MAKPKTSAEYTAMRDAHETAAIAGFEQIAENRLLTEQARLATIASAHLNAATYFAGRITDTGGKK